MGKIKLCLAGILLSMGICFSKEAVTSAANFKSPYIAEQAIAKAPKLTAIVTGKKMKKDVAVKGNIDEINLSQQGEITTFKDSGQSIHYIILMDNSGSVNQKQFDKAKEEVISLRKSLRKDDALELYTVGTESSTGEKTDILERTAKGSEKKKLNQDVKAIEEIPYLSSASSKTVLYRSINQILASETNPRERTILLLITDGEDDSEGKDIDSVSTKDQVASASIPVYGILLNDKAKEKNEEKISYTRNKILSEKNCRGYYADCSTDEDTDAVSEGFDTIQKILMKESYVVSMKASTNKTKGQTKLALTVNDTALDPIPVQYSDYEKDTEEPVLVGDITLEGENSISFTLEDENGVDEDSAAKVSNYRVTARGGEYDGKAWAIKNVTTSAADNEVVVTIIFEKGLYTSDYLLRIRNVSDLSQDKNKMETEEKFTVKDGVKPEKKPNNKLLMIAGGLLLLALILIIVIIAYYRRKQKKMTIVPEEEEIIPVDTKKIRLRITDRTGMIQDVDWNVEGSLFVGRSSICNINFDDDRLSKQHFVIEVSTLGCNIMDLESTNGTFVNGMKLTSRRMLLDGDVITAGREKFEFFIPKE